MIGIVTIRGEIHIETFAAGGGIDDPLADNGRVDMQLAVEII